MGKHTTPSRARFIPQLARRIPAVPGLSVLAATATVVAFTAAVEHPAFGGTSAAGYVLSSNVTDTMSRTVSGGFGTADVGGSYTASPSNEFGVSSGAGHVTPVATGTVATATLAPTNRLDEQFQSTFSLAALPTSGTGATFGLDLRRQSNGDRYTATVRVAPTGALAVSLDRVRHGLTTTLAGPTTVATATAGAHVVLEGYVAGGSPVQLHARAYLAGATAPAWQLSPTDSSGSRVSKAGQLGLSMAVASNTPTATFAVYGVLGWALTTPSTTSSAPAPASSSASSSSAAPSPTTSSSLAPATSTAATSAAAAKSSATTTSAASSPSPTSATTTASTPNYPVPATIASNCSTDVTSALTSFVNGVPDNSTITFAAGGCYLVQGTLEFRSRNGLTFEGNGATVKATTTADDTRSHFRFIYGSNLTMRNLTIVGADTAGGTSTAYNSSLQHQMGIDLRGVKGAQLSNLTITQVYGDCIYIGVGYDNTTWTTNVNAHDDTCSRNGRSGMSVTAGSTITFDHNSVLQPGLWGVDIEPNGGSTGAVGVTISNSTFTPGGHLEPFVQAVGNSGGGKVSDISIIGNTLKGMTLTAQFYPASGQVWSNFTFANNKSDTAAYLIYNQHCGCVVVVNVSGLSGVTVQNNYQPAPGTDETFLYTYATCGVSQSGNQFPGGGTIATVAPYTCT